MRRFSWHGLQQKASVWMQEPEVYERIQLAIHDTEPPTPENTSNADTQDHSLSSFDKDQQPPSTRLLKLAENELMLRPCYRLHSQILHGGPITETMRAKLRSFLMEECSKQCLLRETYALACTLADLFFAHGGTVSTADYQSLQLGCLILATKIKEGKFPTISFQTFSREQLMGFEIQVVMRLAFQLSPPTYHNYAERMVFLWDAYTQQEGIYNTQISHTKMGVNQPLRSFYEQLDCAFMVLRTLDYDIEDLVVNLFYINVRKINVETPDPAILTPQELEVHFYQKNDKFRSFFETFLQIYSKKPILLNPRTGAYLKHFLNVRTSQSKWIFSCNNDAVDSMRRWDKVQSVPQGNYQLAKTVIQKINRNQL